MNQENLEQTFVKKSVGADMAQRMIDAATAKAQELGAAMTIAVLDEGGHLKAFRRMDNAGLLSVEVAQRKAYTALMGMPSQAFGDIIKDSPVMVAAIQSLPRVLLLGGGLPIVVDNAIVGAIGVSGGMVDQDIACAQAGIDVITNQDRARRDPK